MRGAPQFAQQMECITSRHPSVKDAVPLSIRWAKMHDPLKERKRDSLASWGTPHAPERAAEGITDHDEGRGPPTSASRSPGDKPSGACPPGWNKQERRPRDRGGVAGTHDRVSRQ